MTDRIASLPPDEKCCAEALALGGMPHAMTGFVMHSLEHGLDAERRATLWTQELLVQAALGFTIAAGERGCTRYDDPEGFAAAARVAWHEAAERRRSFVRVRQ